MIKSENLRLCQRELIYRRRFADVSRPKGPTYTLLLHVALRGRERKRKKMTDRGKCVREVVVRDRDR